MAIAAWELGPDQLPFMRDEIIERIRAYGFDAMRVSHPYLTDEEMKKFDEFFEFGLKLRKDYGLPDIGDIPGLKDL